VQIYNGEEQGQNFGRVQNAFIRAVDNRGKEMARFDLSGGVGFSQYRSMLFAEMVREQDGWKFNAIGSPDQSDSFIVWLKQYL
jgi:stress response protein SCP2